MSQPKQRTLTPGQQAVVAELPRYAQEAAPRVFQHPMVLVVDPRLAGLAKQFRMQPRDFIEMLLGETLQRLHLGQIVGGLSVEEELGQMRINWRARQRRTKR